VLWFQAQVLVLMSEQRALVLWFHAQVLVLLSGQRALVLSLLHSPLSFRAYSKISTKPQ